MLSTMNSGDISESDREHWTCKSRRGEGLIGVGGGILSMPSFFFGLRGQSPPQSASVRTDAATELSSLGDEEFA